MYKAGLLCIKLNNEKGPLTQSRRSEQGSEVVGRDVVRFGKRVRFLDWKIKANDVECAGNKQSH